MRFDTGACLARRLGSLAAGLGLALVVSAAAAAAPSPKLDPRLLSVALERAPLGTPLSVWLEFTDKGEQGPADLAARLAAAEALLTPRARARRERAHVRPLVDYLDLPVEPSYVAELRARGLAPYGVSRWFNGAAVRVAAADLNALATLPFVRRIAPVERALRSAPPEQTPPSPLPAVPTRVQATRINYGQMALPLGQINVPAVHDSGYIGTGKLVCILDEGFNNYDQHEALIGATVLATRDFVDQDEDVQDLLHASGYWHGTWVMGCLAGRKAGTYVGSAYGALFMLGRTENAFSEMAVEMVNWGMGAEWADSAGADVISSSVGYTTFDTADTTNTYADMNGHTTLISRAAEIAVAKGILVVESAGNDGSTPWRKISAPADVNGDSLIAVGAVDVNGVPAAFSSHGPSSDGRVKPDLAADGVSVPTVNANGTNAAYQQLNGTSFSAPILAGLATCLLQARPSWTPSQVILALRKTASRANSPDTLVGYGIPNGLAALRWTSDTVTVPPGGSGPFALRLLGPNPLRSKGPATRVRYSLAAVDAARAHVRVYDTQGRVVRELALASSGDPGGWTTRWDGLDVHGRHSGSGVYFITLEAGGRSTTVRIVALP